MKRVAFGEINDRSRVWRPSSSHETPGVRALGVVCFNAWNRNRLRVWLRRPKRRESGGSGRSYGAEPPAAAFWPVRSQILLLTADRPVNARRAE